MSRRKKAAIREILPDPKYKDLLISKFVNCLMRKGKKVTAEKILYDAIDLIGERTKESGLEVFRKAVENA